jgi:hypothetical protein
MRKACIILTVLFTVSVTAQTHELLKHNGEKLEINYIKTDQNLLHFSTPQDPQEHTISKFAVASVRNKSNGDIQTISSKAAMQDKKSFQNVVILKENETIGLQKGEAISCFFGINKGMAHYDLMEMKKRRLKEKASKKGSPFIVITSESNDETKALLYNY